MKQLMLNLQPQAPTEAVLIIDGRIVKKVVSSLDMSEKISVMEYIPKWGALAKYANAELSKINNRMRWKRYYFEFGEIQELEIFHKSLNKKFLKDFKPVLISTKAEEEGKDKLKEFIEFLGRKNSHIVLVTDDYNLIPSLADIKSKNNESRSVVFCGYLEPATTEALKQYDIDCWDIVSSCKAAREIPTFKPINSEEFDPSKLL
jgi:hypothetical protein